MKKHSNILDRRTFLKNSAMGFAFLAFNPHLRSEADVDELIWDTAKDELSWESVMGQRWKRPQMLDRYAGVHPRMFVSTERIELLKQKITGTHRPIWNMVKEEADSLLGHPPPSDYTSQGDMRPAGRGIPWQAIAFLLTGRHEYLENAKKWVLTICTFPRWENNKSLSAGECLFGVAIGYDWLFSHFSVQERTFVREKLTLQAEALKVDPVHKERWLANHNHVEHLGLGAAGFALFDEEPKAIDWIRQADLVFRQMLKTASDDGSSTEGHQYWAYTTEALLRYLELARDLLSSNYYNHAWLKRAPEFIINSTTPDFNKENCVMTFGDAARTFTSHGPTHILYRLAAEYRNSHAQWLAQEMDRRKIGRRTYCTWTNLLWYDETLSGTELASRPTFGHAEDIGWVTSRSQWAEDAVMTGFKCGPMHGHKVQPYYNRQFDENWAQIHELGGGHGHPDVNSFQIYAYGKWLAIDPGYERPKTTASHNTLLVNGKGQLGEGSTWFDRETIIRARASSKLTKVEAKRGYIYAVGDAGTIYPAATGLTRFHRHFVYLKPDVIVLVDDLRSEKNCTIDWLLHTEVAFSRKSDRAYLARNGDVEMDVELLLPAQADTEHDGKMLKLSTAMKQQTFIVAVLHPRKAGTPSIRAGVELSDDSEMTVVVDRAGHKREINFNLNRQEVRVSV